MNFTRNIIFDWLRVIPLIILIVVFFAANEVDFAQRKPAKTENILTNGRRLAVKILREQSADYTVSLKAGDFFDAEAVTRGADAVLTLLAPNGEEMFSSDFFTTDFGREIISLEAATGGIYTLRVRAKPKSADAVYELTSRVRRADAQFRVKHRAERLLMEAKTSYDSADENILRQAVGKTRQSLELWREIKDDFWESYNLNLLGRFADKSKDDRQAVENYQLSLAIREKIGDANLIENVLSNLGLAYTSLGDYQKSLECWQRALKLNAQTRSLAARADELFGIGRDYYFSRELEKALSFYQPARAAYEKLKDEPSLAKILNNLGITLDDLKQYEKALVFLNQSLEIKQKHSLIDSSAFTLYNIAIVYKHLKSFDKAEKFYLAALDARRRFTNLSDEAAILRALGNLYNDDLSRYERAVECFQQELLLRQKLANDGDTASAYTNLGNAQDSLKQYEAALKSYHQSMDLWKRLKSPENEIILRRNIGLLYEHQNLYLKAEESYNESLKLSRETKNYQGETKGLSHLADLYEKENQFPKAVELYEQALKAARQIPDVNREADILSNLGFRYYASSRYDQAVDCFTESLKLYQQLKDDSGQDQVTDVLSDVYYFLGDYDQALELAEADLKIAVKKDDEESIATSYCSLAELNRILNHYETALQFAEKSLAISRKRKFSDIEATSLGLLGKIAFDKDDNDKAAGYLNQSLKIARDTNDSGQESEMLAALADVEKDRKNYRRQFEYLLDTLLLNLDYGDPQMEAGSFTSLAAAADGLNKTRMDAAFGKQAINLFQSVRGQMRRLDNETQKVFLRDNDEIYYGAASILIKTGRLAEAFQVVNAIKDQQYFDFNQKARETLPPPLALTAREAEFAEGYKAVSNLVRQTAQDIAAFQREIAGREPNAGEAARLEKLKADGKAANEKFKEFFKQTEEKFDQPADEKDIVKQTPELTELQTILRAESKRTGENTVAVYTLIYKESFRALIVTSDDIKTAVRLNGSEVNQTALQLWAVLQSDTYDPQKLSQKLYSMIFQPIEEKLPAETKTILWSLDGNLRYVPMAALYDGNDYLVKRFNNVLLTRADRERLSRAVSAKWTGIGFGSSARHTVKFDGENVEFDPLPGVTKELDAVFRQNHSDVPGILDGKFLSDPEFSKSSMLKALEEHRPLVHIASHFSFRPGDESHSFLLMGDGTPFSLSEMKRHPDLFDGVELLTLSACNTAAQQSGATGREIDGFAELAQRLGAASVMATLWSVSDNSTPWLMRSFYAEREAGKTKADALQQAQIKLLTGFDNAKPSGARGAAFSVTPLPVKIVVDANRTRGEKLKISRKTTRGSIVVHLEGEDAVPWNRLKHPPFAHPFYWSPFVLYGNWK